MQKRGQVAVFVILGIVIVIAVVILIYLAASRTRTTGSEITASQADIDSAMKEANALINSCLEKLSKEAIRSASRYGGFATRSIIPGHADNCYSAYLSVLPVPYFPGRGIDIRIPYVYPCYDHPPNPYCTDILTLLSNSLSSNSRIIETCLERHVNKEIDVCVKEFSDLEDDGWEVVGDDDLISGEGTRSGIAEKHYKTEVTLNPSGGTTFTLQIPRTFNKGSENSFAINQFNYEHLANFREIIQLANDLVNDYAFDGAGNLRQNRLNEYGRFNREKAIPSDYELKFGTLVVGADYFRLEDSKSDDVQFEFVFALKRPPCNLGQDPISAACCAPPLDPNVCYSQAEFDQLDVLIKEAFENIIP